jgi:anti-sigma regulatory factor (Ser/Thr protein kinase)
MRNDVYPAGIPWVVGSPLFEGQLGCGGSYPHRARAPAPISRIQWLGEGQMLVMGEQIAPPRSSWPRQSMLTIAALPTATPCARLHARTIACEWRLRNLANTIELVVSELVTNAVQVSMDHDGRPRFTSEHGLACIHLRLSTDGVTALVEVWDENFKLPAPTRATLDDESGRGLMLVDALAIRWGWDRPPSGRGKVVWALLET